MLYFDGYGSYVKIANLVNQDHATVLYSKKTILNYIDMRDKRFYPEIRKVLAHYNLTDKFKLIDNEQSTLP